MSPKILPSSALITSVFAYKEEPTKPGAECVKERANSEQREKSGNHINTQRTW